MCTLLPAAASRLAVVAEVLVRPCQQEDLELLEWFGLYRHHREIVLDAFARHLRGDWAVRVFPFLRGLGIGTRLMQSAEELLRERGFGVGEVGVEKDNEAAHRLYVRLGYEPHGDVLEEYAYTTPDGESARHVVDQWILRKRLLQSQA